MLPGSGENGGGEIAMRSDLNNLNADLVGNHVARASSPAGSGGVPPPGKGVAGKGWLDVSRVLSFSERRAGTPGLPVHFYTKFFPAFFLQLSSILIHHLHRYADIKLDRERSCDEPSSQRFPSVCPKMIPN